MEGVSRYDQRRCFLTFRKFEKDKLLTLNKSKDGVKAVLTELGKELIG